MKVEFLKDAQGNTESVHINVDKAEWPDVARQLNVPVEEVNPFDQYRLTESLNSILNGLVALSSREQLLEERERTPDKKRLTELDALQWEALKLLDDPHSFSSVVQMQQLVDHYGPVLQEQKKKSLLRKTA
ncbi:MAG TPA: hypothetical protein VIM55_10070 [Mucilaginibacter sp.]